MPTFEQEQELHFKKKVFVPLLEKYKDSHADLKRFLDML
jgi:hypothetical protein